MKGKIEIVNFGKGVFMSNEKLKDRRITIRITDEIYDDFSKYIENESKKVGTKLTQSQAFEILLNNSKKCKETVSTQK